MTDYPGLVIDHDGHLIRLKWHKLLRQLDGPLFSGETLALGSALGASMEIDLRVRRDGGFVLLHDDTLEGETNGLGRVSDALPADLRSLRMKSGGHALTLSEDLAAMLGTAHPQTLLQFDMKDDLSAIGTRGIAHLATYFANLGDRIIVSAADPALILAVKERLPTLKRGLDPTDRLIEMWSRQGLMAVERELVADLKGPTEPDTIYLEWRLLTRAAKEGLDLIGLCHAHGQRVDAWTWNPAAPLAGFDEDEWRDFRALVALKPDQITTDECQRVEQTWSERVAVA